LKKRVLAIDVGNTSVHCGLFAGSRLVKDWRIATDRSSEYQSISKRISEYHSIRKVVVASVVPGANKILRKHFPNALFVGYKNIGLKIRVKRPSEAGADRLVDALAAYRLYGGPAIIVDFGTATTFDVINGQGEYLGGAIAPGLLLARDTLHERTARLPRIKLRAPRRVIGRDTVEAMRSGLVFGYVAMVEGMVERIKSKIKSLPRRQPGQKSKIKVIATGGLARLICKYTKVVDIIDDKLTLQGLRLIAERIK
jgi:type III pantothenate kinase